MEKKKVYTGKEVLELLKKDDDILDHDWDISVFYFNIMRINNSNKNEFQSKVRNLKRFRTLRDFIYSNSLYLKEIEKYGKVEFDDNNDTYLLTTSDIGELYLRQDGILYIEYKNDIIQISTERLIRIDLAEHLDKFLNTVTIHLNGRVMDNIAVEIINKPPILPILSFNWYNKTFIYPNGTIESEVWTSCKQMKFEIMRYSIKSGSIYFEFKKGFNHENYEISILEPLDGIGDPWPPAFRWIMIDAYVKYWEYIKKLMRVITDTVSLIYSKDFTIIARSYDDIYVPEWIEVLFDDENTPELLYGELERRFKRIFYRDQNNYTL